MGRKFVASKKRRSPSTKQQTQPISLTEWKRFGFYELKQQKKAIKALAEARNVRPSANIDVAYRDDGTVRGTGAHFDHRTIQLIAKVPTVIANLTDTTAHLSEYMENHVGLRLPFVENQEDPHGAPRVVTNPESLDGLLFLPGVPRSIKESSHQFAPRIEQNNLLIQDAINRGKPILAVCGGSWALWQFFGGELVPVKDHCASRMPNLNRQGTVGYNTQIHRIELQNDGYILKAAMAYEQYQEQNPFPAVNSVHWLAPGGEIPQGLDISARSLFDEALAPQNRHQQQMHPEENVIECFESSYGAPILGVVWHPEAYTNNTKDEFFPQQHQGIIRYMAEASRTYKIKQQVNRELLAVSADFQRVLKTVEVKKEWIKTETSDDELYPGASKIPFKLGFWQQAYRDDKSRLERMRESNPDLEVIYEEVNGYTREVICL